MYPGMKNFSAIPTFVICCPWSQPFTMKDIFSVKLFAKSAESFLFMSCAVENHILSSAVNPWSWAQGCQISLGPNVPKRENIPNDYKLYQTAINYTKWR
jgi:hypothetical protein